ncbi:MAG: FliA/WhiG family RNA polymerase sigma factor [Acidobacteria bacterium]|nr:FliA/WhiG family RNA polymerase sigma factor [Acidobacteriota bacterium]
MTSCGAAAKRAPDPNAGIANLTREERILKHLPLVRAIAARVRETLPVQVEIDDLVHAGVLGLFDAVDKFDPDKNVVFHLYAKHRIRGAILDSLRQLDWASRDLRKRYKSFESAANQQAQKLGRSPTEEEVAQAVGVPQPIFQRQKMELYTAGLANVAQHRVEKPETNGFIEATEALDRQPDRLLVNRELQTALNGVISGLPERYQIVIRLYYLQERTMKQIGAHLGVNESRVSQIHKAALEKLAAAMKTNGFPDAGAFLEEIRVDTTLDEGLEEGEAA